MSADDHNLDLSGTEPIFHSGTMVGQWFGSSCSNEFKTNTAIVVNIEARYPKDGVLIGVRAPDQQRTIADARIEVTGDNLHGKTGNFRVYDQTTKTVVPYAEFYKHSEPNEKVPNEAEYSGVFDGTKITGTYTNNLGHTGQFGLWRTFSEASFRKLPPQLQPITPMSWAEFKQHIVQFREKGRFLFRGQHSNIFPLRTAFHRKGRNNLPLYLMQECSRLRHHINSISSHYYQETPEDLYGLLSLAQHHGFPTPLLDWTESPYVAAFFAFDCLAERCQWNERKDRPPVRIFTFDLHAWLRASVSRIIIQSLNDPCPDLQFFRPHAHNNPRYYPQQSVAAFSNIDNIEDFIGAYELDTNTRFLTRIDIHAHQREEVEDELRFMGITPATLFPGIEGACKSLRAELF